MGATLLEDDVEELMSMGAGYVLALKIEGIPVGFAESLPKRVDADATASTPSGFDGVSGALLFDDGASISWEIDRETGFARGDALEFTLSWEALEADGLLPVLFRVPTKRARLTADLTAASVSADVDSTSGWVPGERGYIGRECVTISAITDADTFALTRGDPAYAYRASSPTTFGVIADKPVVWHNRDVEIHLHVLSPEGRIIDTEWLASGGMHRILWRGTIDGQPRESEFGMRFRALPEVRKPSQKLGYELGVEVVVPTVEDAWTFGDLPVVETPEAMVTFEGEFTGPSSGSFRITVQTATTEVVSTLQAWAGRMQSAIDTAFAGQAWYTGCQVGLSGLLGGIGSIRAIAPGSVIFEIFCSASYSVTPITMIVHDIGTYWLTPGQREGRRGLGPTPGTWHWSEGWPSVNFSYPAASWLPVVQTSGEGYADLEVPSAGVAVLEVEGKKELLRWDRTLTPAAPLDYIRLLHLVERGVAGTPILDLSGGAELKFVTGDDGTPAEVCLTLMESSGTGTRGDYDTLGLGLGLGIPASHIDEASFEERLELNESSVAIFSDGRTSLEELLGGWFALQGLCVVQRNAIPSAADGWDRPLQLAVVRTEPAKPTIDPAYVVTLLPSDVDLGGIGQPDSIDSPTEVRVSRSGVDRDRPDVMPQDVPAIQALGLTTKEFSAPGMGERTAADAAMSRIVVGLGQGAVTIGVVPWLRPLLQLGSPCKVALAHPSFYDWTTGTRAPSLVHTVVVGVRFVLRTGRFYVTLLKAGIAPETVFLARGEPVTGVFSTTSFGTATTANVVFAPTGTTKALVYNPGRESLGELAVLELSSDGEGSGGWSLTSGTLPAWVAAGTSWITFGELGTNDVAVEDSYMFYSASRRWGP